MKKIIVLIILVVLVSTFLVQLQGCSNNSCQHIEKISRDIEKVSYLKSWIQNNISKTSFLKHMGWLGQSRALDNPEHFKKLNLNLKFLGINPHYASVKINRDFKDRDDYMDYKNIKSVTFGDGRNKIIIKVNNSFTLGEDIENIKANLKKINGQIYVYCDGTTKRKSND